MIGYNKLAFTFLCLFKGVTLNDFLCKAFGKSKKIYNRIESVITKEKNLAKYCTLCAFNKMY